MIEGFSGNPSQVLIHLFPRSYDLARLGQQATVREALEEDFSKIWDIYRKVLSEGLYTPTIRGETALDKYGDLWRRDDEGRRFTTLLCEVGGRIVGYATIEESIWDISRHVGELGIAVLPESRGIGVGSALLDSLLKVASERGFEKLTLSVYHTNKPAINLYKRFGFKKVGRKKRQFNLRGQYIDEVIMEKFIE
jgi:ribosomal protein S18 acetylase RimI-like enzyme